MEIQRSLGADIIMTFDECTPSGAEHDYVRASVKLTEQWARQCLEEGKKTGRPFLELFRVECILSCVR